MLAKNTVEILRAIGNRGKAGISRLTLRQQFPDMTTTMIPRFKETNLITGLIPESGRKNDELLTVTPEGVEKLQFYQDNPDKISKVRGKLGPRDKPAVKIPSSMDDAMRRHLQKEARIGQDNEVINGVLQTVYATIVAGLETVPKTEASTHPMEQHNQLLRSKLVALKEQLENDHG